MILMVAKILIFLLLENGSWMNCKVLIIERKTLMQIH